MFYIAYTRIGTKQLVDIHREVYKTIGEAKLQAKIIRSLCNGNVKRYDIKIVQGKSESFYNWALKKYMEKAQ